MKAATCRSTPIILLLLFSGGGAEAAIIYTEFDPGLRYEPGAGAPHEYPIDINNDNTIDFTLEASIFSFSARTDNGTRFADFALLPHPDDGGFAQILTLGQSIGPVGSNYDWDGDITYFISCADFGMGVECNGIWTFVRGYLGIELQIDGQTHYGWVDIEQDNFVGQGTIHGWAWESEPGVPILAGAIPEPSVLFLLSFSALAFLKRKRS